MSFLDLKQLPFVGMSHEFHGEKEGAPFSAYIVNAEPGKGPPLHIHPYVEVAFTVEGCATITVGDEQREVKAEVEKPADIVTLRFDVVARNADQAKANQEVQAKAAKVLALLNAANIARSDIIAADLKSEPVFENEDTGRRKGKIILYSVT